MIVLFLALVSWGAFAQHDHASHGAHSNNQMLEPTFKDKSLDAAYSHYIHLKNALVASDFKKSEFASKALAQAIHQVKTLIKFIMKRQKSLSPAPWKTNAKLLLQLAMR
jgi:hypothetical protein